MNTFIPDDLQRLHAHDLAEVIRAIVLWGTFSGAMIPFLLQTLKLDPATSSAPFVATLVDVTGLVIYFTVASLILTGKLL
jgi:magnesium transporter